MTHTTWMPNLAQYQGPKYLALVQDLRDQVRGGVLAPGDQLPTVRDLAWTLKITPGTVSRAYQLATQEGLLAATVGRGTFVAEAAPRFGPKQSFYRETDPAMLDGRIDMRSPRLPEVGQGQAFADAYEVLRPTMLSDWLDYPRQDAERPLRAALVDWVAGRALGPVSADDMALTYGGQHAVNLVFQCCLRGDRPVVLLEDLAYAGFRHAAKLSRAEVVGVEMDDEGILPNALEAACRKHRPQILCLTTEAQNPTAARMGPARRAAVAGIARAFDLQVVEDDCYTTAASAEPALRALAPERVWSVGSLSKMISASLRLGYVICPEGMGRAGRLTAQHGIFALARPVSDLCLELLRSGRAESLRRDVNVAFADRLAAVVEALGPHGLCWQEGLPFVWLPLPSGWRAAGFARMAEDAGVLVRTADEFALVHGRAPNAVRLALPGNHSAAVIGAACARLGQLLLSPAGELAV